MKDLTIVIPSYERHSFLERAISFWSKFEVKLLILDGSMAPLPGYKDNCLHGNIKYINRQVSVKERLHMASTLLDTKYIAMIGDDEFFIPSGLKKCMEELDLCPEYVSCMGRALRFKYDGNSVIASLVYEEMENHSLSGEDPIQRINTHMSNYTCATIYSVVRSEVWREAANIAFIDCYDTYNAEEIQFELAVAYQGKTKVIPVLTWLRSDEALPVRMTANFSDAPIKYFSDYWFDDKNYFDRKIITSNIVRKMKKLKVEDRINEDVLEKLLEVYSRNEVKYYPKNIYLINLIIKFSKLAPKKIRLHLKNVFKQIFELMFDYSYPIQRKIEAAGASLELNGVYVCRSELKIINELILDFYKKNEG